VHNNGPINISEVLARLDGDKELLDEIWLVFLTETPRQMELMKEALDTAQVERVFELAHALKRAAASIGAESVNIGAFEMELAARNKSIQVARNLHGSLVIEVADTLRALCVLLAQDNTLVQSGE
jgi:HPt (histidine-containing phosphotransfer) domain-containing protein